jgi:hypothetical protein
VKRWGCAGWASVLGVHSGLDWWLGGGLAGFGAESAQARGREHAAAWPILAPTLALLSCACTHLRAIRPHLRAMTDLLRAICTNLCAICTNLSAECPHLRAMTDLLRAKTDLRSAKSNRQTSEITTPPRHFPAPPRRVRTLNRDRPSVRGRATPARSTRPAAPTPGPPPPCSIPKAGLQGRHAPAQVNETHLLVRSDARHPNVH